MRALIFTGILIMTAMLSLDLAGQQTNGERHLYREIHTQELKEWYAQGKNMIVVDARSKNYDGTLLPQAIWLPHDAPEQQVHALLPSKNSLIVVYCCNPSCSASQLLVDRLTAEGYTDVYKYPEGLQEWKQQGLPTNNKREEQAVR